VGGGKKWSERTKRLNPTPHRSAVQRPGSRQRGSRKGVSEGEVQVRKNAGPLGPARGGTLAEESPRRVGVKKEEWE
jgi:hypothetical protein